MDGDVVQDGGFHPECAGPACKPGRVAFLGQLWTVGLVVSRSQHGSIQINSKATHVLAFGRLDGRPGLKRCLCSQLYVRELFYGRGPDWPLLLPHPLCFTEGASHSLARAVLDAGQAAVGLVERLHGDGAQLSRFHVFVSLFFHPTCVSLTLVHTYTHTLSFFLSFFLSLSLSSSLSLSGSLSPSLSLRLKCP